MENTRDSGGLEGEGEVYWYDGGQGARGGVRVEQMRRVQGEALEIFKRKNADYGDAFARYGHVGVLVRIGDKLSRYASVSGSGIRCVRTETLRDTLLDLHNYAAMALMLLDEGGGSE